MFVIRRYLISAISKSLKKFTKRFQCDVQKWKIFRKFSCQIFFLKWLLFYYLSSGKRFYGFVFKLLATSYADAHKEKKQLLKGGKEGTGSSIRGKNEARSWNRRGTRKEKELEREVFRFFFFFFFCEADLDRQRGLDTLCLQRNTVTAAVCICKEYMQVYVCLQSLSCSLDSVEFYQIELPNIVLLTLFCTCICAFVSCDLYHCPSINLLYMSPSSYVYFMSSYWKINATPEQFTVITRFVGWGISLKN